MALLFFYGIIAVEGLSKKQRYQKGKTRVEQEEIRISVRNLVEFILRSGDLDNRRGGMADKEAMARGGRIHRKIQRQMSGAYQAEVPLVYEKKYDEFSIRLEGRADGIITDEDGYMIDEIKGIYRDVNSLLEPVPVHLAQAKCYALIWAREKNLEQIRVQMTYCNLDTEEIRRFSSSYSTEELGGWFDWLLDSYYRWANWQYQWKRKRNQSMQGLEFPFPYREGQREVVSSVYRTILRKKQLFLQAPTGLGKTMSTVFPAVRSMGEGISEKVFYLTAKTLTRKVAWEAFDILRKKGLACKVLILTAKEKMCVCDKVDCNPSACPRAKGHFDRVNEAVFELLNRQDGFDRETLLAQSEAWQVCPYEMSLDVSTWVDAVICDYNYVFDPDAHLRRFFGEGNRGDYVFLIDEAHNLAERGREMYSAKLYKEDVLAVRKLVKPLQKKLAGYLDKCNQQMLVWKRESETYQILDSLGSLGIHLMNVMGELEVLLEELEPGELREKILDFYFQVRTFLNIHDLVDDNYVIYTRHDEENHFFVRLFCVNPAENLQRCVDKGISAVYFSATLLPVTYYRKLLSGRSDDYAVYAGTPFSQNQKLLLLGRDVSSRYTRRTPEEFEKICRYISQAAAVHPGNYMIFFPSYKMLQDVYEVYVSLYGEGQEILLQNPSMNEKEREEFLGRFEEQKEEGALLGFCVMGGVFAEGIDLTGEQLVGALVVGTGIPQISCEREILKNFYDAQGVSGFDYAYRFPGMNKVLQSAGRVIRTVWDRGVILLLDERFCSWEYRTLFPREWADYQICTRDTAADWMRKFWEKDGNGSGQGTVDESSR